MLNGAGQAALVTFDADGDNCPLRDMPEPPQVREKAAMPPLLHDYRIWHPPSANGTVAPEKCLELYQTLPGRCLS